MTRPAVEEVAEVPNDGRPDTREHSDRRIEQVFLSGNRSTEICSRCSAAVCCACFCVSITRLGELVWFSQSALGRLSNSGSHVLIGPDVLCVCVF